MFLILLLNALFAFCFIIAKAVLQYSPPIFFIGIRMILAGSILLIYELLIKKERFKIVKSDYSLFAKLSIVHIFIPYVFEFMGLKYVTAAKTAMLFSLSPFITALVAYFKFHEKLSKLKLAGLTLGFCGFLPILFNDPSSEKIAGQWWHLSLPEIFIIIAVISSAYAWTIIQDNAKKNIPFVLLNGVSMLGGGILSLITSFIFEGFDFSPLNCLPFIYLMVTIILVGNIASYNLYGLLLKQYTSTFLSFAGFSIPVFTAIFQYFIFGETINTSFYLTLLFVGLGLFVFYRQELSKGIVRK